MVTRRLMLGAGLALAIPARSATAQTEESAHAATLRVLIEQVVQAGDVSLLPELFAADATLPDYGVSGLATFMQISEVNHTMRQETYADYAFEIVAIADIDDWALGYVRFVATPLDGDPIDTPGFYAAHFNRQDLIDQLFIGTE